MGIRDQIWNAKDDFKTETVDVPEWGVKLVMRELSVHDRNELTLRDFEQVEVSDGWALKPKYDPIAGARVVVMSAYDEDGSRVFEDDDADQLAKRAFSVVERLADVTRRLSGLGKDLRFTLAEIRDEIAKGADLNRVDYLISEALDGDAVGKEPASGSSETPAG